jgi:hypothetical protein
METPQIYQFGSDNGGWNNAWPLYAMNGGNGFLGGGLGSGFIGGIFGGLLSNIFGWGNGNFGGNGNGAAAALGAQAQNNNNTDLLMNAITSTGAQQTQAIQALSAALGQDFNLVNSQISAITTTLNQIAIQNATTPLKVINAINSGNAALQAQFSQCCCENRLAICQQTNQIEGAINGQGQRQVDAIADLKATMIQEFCAARERDMQAKIDTQADIITQQRGQIDNANQTAQINAYVGSIIAPLQKQINEIAAKQPNTVSVQYPNLVAVNATPYVSGGYYGQYPNYGNGFNGIF